MGDSKIDSTKDGSKAQRIESLGWLTESSVMPKKQRAIAGVGASTIVELRAQLYRSQEDAKRTKDGGDDLDLHRSRKKSDLFTKKNAGVEERANRDKLQLKAETDGSASYTALEKKAELYEKLVRGELPDEEDKEKYSVDFLRKGLLQDEFEEMDRESKGEKASIEQEINHNSELPAFDRRAGIGWKRDGFIGLTQEHKQLVREVNEETKEAREKASLLKQHRQLQAEKKREKLRQAFIRKKLEKLKNAVQSEKYPEPHILEDVDLQSAADRLSEASEGEADKLV
eukprot:c25207_g1_i1 orf=871-1725(-)